MLNETLNQSVELTFESVTNITLNPLFLIAIVTIWLLPLIIYIMVGVCVRGKTSSGVKLKDPMIYSPNFWYSFFIWFFIQAGLFLIFIMFPIWLEWI